jgi:large subunit ribosomal protein L15
MPLIRRIPKRGFNALFKNEIQIVNVESLNRFSDKSVIGPAELKAAGLIGSERLPVKILGNGKLTKSLIVKAHKVSASAKKLVEAAGSKIEFLK